MDFPGYSLVVRTSLWPASWLPAIDKGMGSKSVDVQRVWEVYDERLQLMSRQDALRLDEALNAGGVSRAWLVWSGAAETALADAYRFCGVLFQAGVWSLVVVVLCFGLFGLVGIRSRRLVAMFLMSTMLLISFCIVTLLSLHCLT